MNQKETVSISDCTIVQMFDVYPFGELKQLSQSEQSVLVRKKLVYQSSAQLEIIRKMVQFLSTLQNEHLITLQAHQLGGDSNFYFYYEYVPLTLEKWILQLGDDILQQLQFETLSMASYLTKHNIKFRFDPKCLGLSKDIKVKYFLHEFAIDTERKMVNYKEAEEEIMAFFHQFRVNNKKSQENVSSYLDRKSADSAMMLNRIEYMGNKRESWDGKQKGLSTVRSKKNLLLSQKIQNSKKKSMQILSKLKNLKPHTGQ